MSCINEISSVKKLLREKKEQRGIFMFIHMLRAYIGNIRTCRDSPRRGDLKIVNSRQSVDIFTPPLKFPFSLSLSRFFLPTLAASSRRAQSYRRSTKGGKMRFLLTRRSKRRSPRDSLASLYVAMVVYSPATRDRKDRSIKRSSINARARRALATCRFYTSDTLYTAVVAM